MFIAANDVIMMSYLSD